MNLQNLGLNKFWFTSRAASARGPNLVSPECDCWNFLVFVQAELHPLLVGGRSCRLKAAALGT